MKAILEFVLPEEEQEFKEATNGRYWNLVVWEMHQWLRTKTKHGDLTDGEYAIYEGLHNLLWDLIDEYNLSFE